MTERAPEVDLTTGHGATAALSRFAADLRYEDIPEHVRAQAKRIIIDTLACIIAAQPYPAAQIIEATIRETGGSREARGLPSGFWTSAPAAAYLMGDFANLLDLDDNLLNHTHFANTAVAAPLAAAQHSGATGRQLIQAVVAAYEVSARLTLAMPNSVEVDGEWPDTTARMQDLVGFGYGTVGAVAGCGNVYGLEPAVMANAFGLAAYGAPVPTGTKANSTPPMTMRKYGSFGQMAWTGALCARQAAKGMTGDSAVLDGPRGFWRMTGATSFNWATATSDLGQRWWGPETSFKLHPICTWNRQPIRAIETILADNPITLSEIENVQVFVHPGAAEFLSWRLQDPADHLQTQMSHPWAMAMTLLKVPPPLWQQAETVSDPVARELASRVTVGVEPKAVRAYYEQTGQHIAGVRRVRRSPATVKIQMKSGAEYSAEADYAAGDPFTPETTATDDQLREKFLSFGETVLAREQLEQAADALFSLEIVDDLPGLIDLMCTPE